MYFIHCEWFQALIFSWFKDCLALKPLCHSWQSPLWCLMFVQSNHLPKIFLIIFIWLPISWWVFSHFYFPDILLIYVQSVQTYGTNFYTALNRLLTLSILTFSHNFFLFFHTSMSWITSITNASWPMKDRCFSKGSKLCCTPWEIELDDES